MSPQGDSPSARTLFGQPRGLAVLAGTELWDRISFHGMQALLVLYMVHQLLLPGHAEAIAGFGILKSSIAFFTGPLSVRALATQIFGLYVGLIYFAPVIGGILGDRWLGRRTAIIWGGLLMTVGHFSLAFDTTFLLALLLLILGAGLLRGNLSPQMAELYAPSDRRRDVAFQIYGMVLNFAAFVAPIVTGQLAQSFGWHYGFAFAGLGMLAGVIIYTTRGRSLPEPMHRAVPSGERTKANAEERRRIGFLLLLVPVASLFWVAQSQVWNTYNLWVENHVRLQYGHWVMPVPWLQSLDGLAPFVLIPPVLMLWHWQARHHREPSEFAKAAIGCFIFALATAWLGTAVWVYGENGRASLVWPIVFHLVSNLGWVYFAPTMSALYTRLAPPTVNATMLGIYSLSVTMGSFVSGRLGALYEQVPADTFWMIHAAIVASCGVFILAFGLAAKRDARAAMAPIAVAE